MNEFFRWINHPQRALWLCLSIVSIGLLQIVYEVHHQLRNVPKKSDMVTQINALIEEAVTNRLPGEKLFTIIVLISLIILGYHIIRQAWIHRMMRLQFEHQELQLLTDAYQQLFATFEKKGIKVRVISHPKLIAMSWGILHPQIILSEKMVMQCNKTELEAILLHEYYHCHRRHPLGALLLKLAAKAGWFLPIIRDLLQYIEIRMELNADRYAIEQLRSPAPIGEILLKMVNQKMYYNHGGVFFAHTAINYRIQQIIDPYIPLDIPLFKPKSLFQSVMFVFLLGWMLINYCM